MRRRTPLPPVVRRCLVAGVVSGALGVGLILLGTIDAARAVVLVVVTVSLALLADGHTDTDTGWRRPPTEERPGGRKDVSELAWAAFSRDGRVTERVLRRVRRIAAARLAAHGIAWDGRIGDGLDGWGRPGHDDAAVHRDRAAALLGHETLARLTTARAAHPRTVNTWLDVLDRLAERPETLHDTARSPR